MDDKKIRFPERKRLRVLRTVLRNTRYTAFGFLPFGFHGLFISRSHPLLQRARVSLAFSLKVVTPAAAY